MLSRVWALRATWMRYDTIPRDWTIYIHAWATECELYELVVIQGNLHKPACFPGASHTRLLVHITMFSGGEPSATGEPARVICPTCAKLHHSLRSKGGIAFDSALIGLRCSLSIRPSISFLIARSYNFPKIRCLSPGFCFGQCISFSCSLGIIHNACVGKLYSLLSVP